MLPCLHPFFSHLAFPLKLSTKHRRQMEGDAPGRDDRPGRPRGASKNNDFVSALQFFLNFLKTCRHSHHCLFSHLALNLELLMQRGRGEERDGPGRAGHHGQPRRALEMNYLVSTVQNFLRNFCMQLFLPSSHLMHVFSSCTLNAA